MISTDTETRSITIETEIAASPDRVWQALTIPEELMRWFPLEARVVPGLGGTMWLSWGYPVVAESTIDIWEPGRRLRTTESRPLGILLQPNQAENPLRSVEYTIEASGDKTLLRLVHSGFAASSNWDKAYSGVLHGWEFQFRSLRHYLERHDGQDRIVAWVKHPVDGTFEQVWESLMAEHGRLGAGHLSHDSEGFPYAISPGREEIIRGTVEVFAPPKQFIATVDDWNDALFRIYLVERPGGGGLDVSIWLATYGVPAARVSGFQERWTDLVRALFFRR
jgi:uncharacterized protein YndB with AHSA1/START domain